VKSSPLEFASELVQEEEATEHSNQKNNNNKQRKMRHAKTKLNKTCCFSKFHTCTTTAKQNFKPVLSVNATLLESYHIC
jgi:hypothetical protein